MKRRLFTMVAALVLAAAGTGLVFLYVQGADRRALAGKQAVEVLVAARAIPAGTPVGRLSAGRWVRYVKMPAETVPNDAVTAIADEPADLVVSGSIHTGELIRRSMLVTKSQSQVFSVPDGKLAMSLALTDPQRVAGHVTAGARVAVFAAYKLLDANGRAKSDATGAKLLMSGIEVLSIGQASAGDTARDGTGSAAARTLVTLAVTQREAEQLVWAAAANGGQGNGLYLGLQTDSTVLDPNGPGVTSFTLTR